MGRRTAAPTDGATAASPDARRRSTGHIKNAGETKVRRRACRGRAGRRRVRAVRLRRRRVRDVRLLPALPEALLRAVAGGLLPVAAAAGGRRRARAAAGPGRVRRLGARHEARASSIGHVKSVVRGRPAGRGPEPPPPRRHPGRGVPRENIRSGDILSSTLTSTVLRDDVVDVSPCASLYEVALKLGSPKRKFRPSLRASPPLLRGMHLLLT